MQVDAYLPSLLDRLADDRHLNQMRQQCETQIDELMSKLSNETQADEQQRQQWLAALRQQQHRLEQVRSSKGSLQAVKDCVKRDLEWLLNTRNLCVADLAETHPETDVSVLNYGLPDLTGKTVSSLRNSRLEKMLESIIQTFEPRIMKNTLKVRLISDEAQADHNALIFEIAGQLWADPLPLHLQLTTQLNLESGDMTILE